MLIYVTMVYGPIAAFLVELFPTRIRYTSMSLPYHIGNGWFGGMLPLLATAMVAANGDIYYGLWYPIVVALMTVVVGFLFLYETKNVDLHADVVPGLGRGATRRLDGFRHSFSKPRLRSGFFSHRAWPLDRSPLKAHHR